MQQHMVDTPVSLANHVKCQRCHVLVYKYNVPSEGLPALVMPWPWISQCYRQQMWCHQRYSQYNDAKGELSRGCGFQSHLNMWVVLGLLYSRQQRQLVPSILWNPPDALLEQHFRRSTLGFSGHPQTWKPMFCSKWCVRISVNIFQLVEISHLKVRVEGPPNCDWNIPYCRAEDPPRPCNNIMKLI